MHRRFTELRPVDDSSPLYFPPCLCGNPDRCPEVRMATDNQKFTIDAAQGRRERDSAAIGAVTPQEQQRAVSVGLDEKAISEGRPFPGTPDRDPQ